MAEDDVVQTSYGPVPREVMEKYRRELGWTDNEIGHLYHMLLQPHGQPQYGGATTPDPTCDFYE